MGAFCLFCQLLWDPLTRRVVSFRPVVVWRLLWRRSNGNSVAHKRTKTRSLTRCLAHSLTRSLHAHTRARAHTTRNRPLPPLVHAAHFFFFFFSSTVRSCFSLRAWLALCQTALRASPPPLCWLCRFRRVVIPPLLLFARSLSNLLVHFLAYVPSSFHTHFSRQVCPPPPPRLLPPFLIPNLVPFSSSPFPLSLHTHI